MSTRKKSDWTETILYVGIFILALVFLYQFLKLWAAGTASLANLGATISNAASNTVAAVESGLNSLVTAPSAFIGNLLGAAPDLLSLGTTFISSLLSTIFAGGLFSSLGTFLSAIFGNVSPILAGAGSSYNTTVPVGPAGPSTTPVSGPPGSSFSIGQ